MIGGGHNGLVAAAYLAKAGARTRRPRGPAQDRRRRRHHGAVAGGARVQGHHAQLRDEPDARHDPARPPARAARLPRASRSARTSCRSPTGAASSSTTTPRRTTTSSPSSPSTTPTRSSAWDAWIGGLADVLGPLLMTTPPTVGSKRPGRPRRAAPAGLAVPRARREDGRRRHPADDDVDRRHPRSVLRVGSGQDRDVAERPDRHVGRAARAGHRLRDGAPLDRRRRRRHLGRVGACPRAGWARWPTRSRRSARTFGAEIRTERARRARSSPRTARRAAWCSRAARSCSRRSSSPRSTRRSRSCEQLDPQRAARRTSSTTSSTGESRSGVVKINLRARPRCRCSPRSPSSPTSVRRVRAGALDRLPREGVRGGARRACRRRCRSRDGVMPTSLDPTLAPEGKHVVSLFTQWVPHEWSEEPHRDELEAYADRVIAGYDELAPGFADCDPAPPGDRAVRDGARVGADRRQHLPRGALGRAAVPHAARARLRRLPHADPRACTSARAPRTAGGGVCGIPGVQLRPRDQARPQAGSVPIGRVEPDDRAEHVVPVLLRQLVQEVAVLRSARSRPAAPAGTCTTTC